MGEYIELELSDLLDMLVKHTTDYTTLRSEGTTNEEEFARCLRKISLIQTAINTKINLDTHKMITIPVAAKFN
jgi:hypothetical protein